MNIYTMAYNNFKNNMKTYTMFFISMVFSVVILSNFFILMCGDVLLSLGKANASYTRMIVQMISFILVIFIFFFIGYTSSIFLKNRKREIGLYTFMGVENKTIGKIYFIEMMLIGVSSCLLGIFIGAFLSKFFQMLIFRLAGFTVNVAFNLTAEALVYTFTVFMACFLFMSIKGFISIVRSKVIDLLNANRKAEKIPKINVLTYVVALGSLGVIVYGYYLVQESTLNVFKTLILVCIGTYGIFYALIPAVFRYIISKKSILYKGENIIAINSLAYRIKKNYTTYATISLLTACTISVLGTAVSMKKLYTMSIQNDNLYSVSFASEKELPKEELESILLEVGDKQYELETTVLRVKSTLKEVKEWQQEEYNILSYEQLIEILGSNGNKEDIKRLNPDMVAGNKVIYIQRPGTLASLIPSTEVSILDQIYEVSEGNIRFKTLGSLLDKVTLVVNNDIYDRIKPLAQEVHFYGIKINHEDKLLDSATMTVLTEKITPYLTEGVKSQVGLYKMEGIAWLKLVYAIGAFLFLVFVLAEASIIYTKIYSDAAEDRNKYKILMNIGVSKRDLSRTIIKEVALLYILPLSVGLLDSFFAIQVLGDFLSENLLGMFLISVSVCVGIFVVSYFISVKSFKQVVKINQMK